MELPFQSWTPLALIGPAHFLISSATNLARYSGDCRSGPARSEPIALSRSFMTGVFMAATAAAWRLRTTGSGVPFGRNKAYQLGMSKSVRPCSSADGRSGKLAERFLLRIASVLMVLLAYCGITVGALGH